MALQYSSVVYRMQDLAHKTVDPTFQLGAFILVHFSKWNVHTALFQSLGGGRKRKIDETSHLCPLPLKAGMRPMSAASTLGKQKSKGTITHRLV